MVETFALGPGRRGIEHGNRLGVRGTKPIHGHVAKCFVDHARIFVVKTGNAGFQEQLISGVELAGLHRQSPLFEQRQPREGVVELPSHPFGALESLVGLINFALASVGQAQQQISPGVGPMVEGCDSRGKLVHQIARQGIMRRERAQKFVASPNGERGRANDFYRVDLPILQLLQGPPLLDGLTLRGQIIAEADQHLRRDLAQHERARAGAPRENLTSQIGVGTWTFAKFDRQCPVGIL